MKSKTIITAIAAALLISFSSCAKKKATAEVSQETVKVTIPQPKSEKIIVDEGFIAPESNGRFNVDEMAINGSILELTVSYSGGCEEHIFKLYSDQMYMKSYPPQLNLFLEHIDNNDRCRAMIIKKLAFDLSGIEYPGTNELIINLNNTRLTVNYKY
jgi:hypothetical protein